MAQDSNTGGYGHKVDWIGGPKWVQPDWTYIPDTVTRPYTIPAIPQPLPEPALAPLPPGSLGGNGNIADITNISISIVTREQFERLLFLLGLSDVEREFCMAIASEKDNKDIWKVYADFLEEQGRIKHSKIARKKGE